MKVRTIVAVGAAAAAVTAAAAVPALASDAAAGGKISFTIVETGIGAKETGAVVIHGAVTAAGRDVSPDTGDHDELYLNGGRLRVVHPNKDATFSFKTNKKTCYFSITGKGTGTFTKGTGKYKGYTGTAKYKISGSGLAKRKKSGSCDFNGVGIAYVDTVTGTGTLTSG